MNILRRYGLLAYYLSGRILPKIVPYFKDLKKPLDEAYINIPLEEYLAAMILTAILLFPGAFIAGTLIIASIGYGWIGSILGGFIIGLLALILVIATFVSYPSFKLRSIKGEIDKFVPYAVTHMATIAGTGVPPQIIFAMMGRFKEYKIVSYICNRISRNVNIFGYDIVTAITEEAKRIPSFKLKDVLWSMSSTIRSGGDLRQVLLEKSKSLMEEQRRIIAKYIEFLSMMAEIYATVFVAGTIIIFVMVSIIGVIGGIGLPVKLLLQLFTYILIPLASLMFIALIGSTKPTGV